MLGGILIGFVLIPLIMTFSIAVVAEPPAGVIAYSCVDQKAQVLLAWDNGKNRNGWAAFGGHGEKGETIAETAAREFREETGCVFQGPLPVSLEQQKRSRIGPFYTYVSRVEWVDPTLIETSSCGTPGERSQWVWVGLEELNKALESGKDVPDLKDPKKRYPLWIAGRLSLDAARSDGLLPADNSVCADAVSQIEAPQESASSSVAATATSDAGNTDPSPVVVSGETAITASGEQLTASSEAGQ